MSLRIRLLCSIALVLFISLVLGGVLIWRHEAQSVRTEMDAAFAVAEHTIQNTIDRLPETDMPERDLKQLIATFDGDRHLRVTLTTDRGETIAASRLAPPPRFVPRWFVDLLGPSPRVAQFPSGPHDGDILSLQTDPQNEITEVWTDFRDNIGIMAVFCGLTFVLIHGIVGRTLKPIGVLSKAFFSIGSGEYGTRVAEQGPPELIRLAKGFNEMVQRLAAAEIRNHSLHEQLLTLQEEERADLARDLHDDVGPFLFAVNVDAMAVSRLADAAGEPAIQEHVRSIRDSVNHMQKHVRAILGRLRPVGLVEFGLDAAIESLAGFWRRRHPETTITVSVEDGDFGERLDETIYRIVQESISNAIRHGRPGNIDIVIASDRSGEIHIDVSDNGIGLPKREAHVGFGLRGMSERVAALGGVLTVANRAGGAGVTVAARLPRQTAPEIEIQAASA